MSEFTPGDKLHRLEKLLLENRTAKSPEQARSILASYSMQFIVGPELADSAAMQVGLLTAVNTAARAIHGEVRVVADLDHPLAVPVPRCETVADAVTALGGVRGSTTSSAPAGLFGSVTPPHEVLSLRVMMSGWRGGVLPAAETPPAFVAPATTLSGAIAGALVVSELFQVLRGVNARAGQRALGYSAWDPGTSWLLDKSDGPAIEHLPATLWVIGLGNLGQSLVWNLSFLPYVDRSAVRLVLQDFDRLKPANISTSPLSSHRNADRMKTRVVAEWAEEIGFQVRLLERAFAADFQLNAEEPRLAFCGVDNIEARAALEEPGFEAVVEAGLGTGEEYHAFQLHTFPGPDRAVQRWSQRRARPDKEWTEGLERIAAAEGLDECGKSELAGLQVASSYVGVVTTALAIGQMLRPLHGAAMHGSVNGTLGSSGQATTVEGEVGKQAPRYGSVVARRSTVKID